MKISKSEILQRRAIVIALSFVSIGILAMVYNVIIIYMPFVHVNYFFTIAYAISIAFMAYVGSYFGLVGTNAARMKLTASLCFLGYLLQMTAFISFLILDKEGLFNVSAMFFVLLHPFDHFFPILADVLQKGWFSLFGAQISGFPLLMSWLIEAGIIFIIPLRFIYTAHFPPFSDYSRMWYPRYFFNDRFNHLPEKTELIEKLKNENPDVLTDLGKGSLNNHSLVTIYYAGGTSAYINFENKRVSRGTGKTESRIMVDKMLINGDYAAKLLSGHPNKKMLLSIPLDFDLPKI